MQTVTLNQRELISINALIAFKAYENETHEELIGAMLTSHFNVQCIKELQLDDYDSVILFLVDLDFKRTLN